MTPISDSSMNITSKDSLITANEPNQHDEEMDLEEARVLSNAELFYYFCKKNFTEQTLKNKPVTDEPNQNEQEIDLEEARVLSNSEFFKIVGKIDDE